MGRSLTVRVRVSARFTPMLLLTGACTTEALRGVGRWIDFAVVSVLVTAVPLDGRLNMLRQSGMTGHTADRRSLT